MAWTTRSSGSTYRCELRAGLEARRPRRYNPNETRFGAQGREKGAFAIPPRCHTNASEWNKTRIES